MDNLRVLRVTMLHLHVAEFAKCITSGFIEFIQHNMNSQWHQPNILEEIQNVTIVTII
jgi:hypothetical protein